MDADLAVLLTAHEDHALAVHPPLTDQGGEILEVCRGGRTRLVGGNNENAVLRVFHGRRRLGQSS